MPGITKTLSSFALHSMEEANRFLQHVLIPQVQELQRVVMAIAGDSADLGNGDVIRPYHGLVTIGNTASEAYVLPQGLLPGWQCVLIVGEYPVTLGIPNTEYTINGAATLSLPAGYRGVLWFFSDLRFFCMEFPVDIPEQVIPNDFDIPSENIVAPLLTLDGGNVRGQLEDLANAFSSVDDFEILSADMTSDDGLATLDGVHVRGQLQQLLDGGGNRLRDYALGLVVESLTFRSDCNTAAIDATAFIVLHLTVDRTSTSAQAGVWAVMRAGTVGSAAVNHPLGSGGWGNLAAPTVFTKRCAVFNNAVGEGITLYGGDGGLIRSTIDHSAFTVRTPGSSYTGNWIACVERGSSGFTLFGEDGEIQTSPDVVTWTRQYNTGGDFVAAAIHDNLADVVGIRAASYVHSANGGVSGHTDAALPLSGAQAVAYHKAHGFLVVGTDGSAVSEDGLTWDQVETAEIIDTGTDGAFSGLHSVAGGFVIVTHGGILYYSTRPSVVGSWTRKAIEALRDRTITMCTLGVAFGRQQLFMVAWDTSQSEPLCSQSNEGRYF